ncbi:MAG: glycoside hydrolase 5 family protein [Solirubrobacteraceae bacterium]
MSRRAIALLLASAILAGCLAASASASASASGGRVAAGRVAASARGAGHPRHAVPAGGINIGGLYPGESAAKITSEIKTAHDLHAKLVRVGMPWSEFEPVGPGQIAPAMARAAQTLIAAAAASHIRVIALLYQTPCWASTAPPSVLATCGSARSRAEAYPPANPADFGRFAGWFAGRYGTDLAAIEVWNEPDQANEDYFAGEEKPRHYAELLKAAYPAIKHADHSVQVLAGSLVGSNGAFMKALYAQGIRGYYDGVAVHFYTLLLASVRSFREVQLEHGDHTPLWLDEFGWSSCWPKHRIEQEQGCVTQAVQAQNIASSLRELARARYIDALLLYGFHDVPGEEFGVISAAGRRKPSFAALAGAFASPFVSPAPITLMLKKSSHQVLASGSGPVGDYMKLEVFESGRRRYESVFTLNRFNRFRLKLPRALGAHLTVRVWQYWLGAGHAVTRRI